MLSFTASRSLSLSAVLAPSSAFSPADLPLPVPFSPTLPLHLSSPLFLSIPVIPATLTVGAACAALAVPLLLGNAGDLSRASGSSGGASGSSGGPSGGPSGGRSVGRSVAPSHALAPARDPVCGLGHGLSRGLGRGSPLGSVRGPAFVSRHGHVYGPAHGSASASVHGFSRGRALPPVPSCTVTRTPTEASGHKRGHADITRGDEEVYRPTSRRCIGDNVPSEAVPAPRGTKRVRNIDADELKVVYKRVKTKYEAGPVMPEKSKKIEPCLYTEVLQKEHYLGLKELNRSVHGEDKEEEVKRPAPTTLPRPTLTGESKMDSFTCAPPGGWCNCRSFAQYGSCYMCPSCRSCFQNCPCKVPELSELPVVIPAQSDFDFLDDFGNPRLPVSSGHSRKSRGSRRSRGSRSSGSSGGYDSSEEVLLLIRTFSLKPRYLIKAGLDIWDLSWRTGRSNPRLAT
ncbi:hypothetical protein CLU79DRAFT_834849 [Phycomyces nitens]|nr:hypothetical protein CLU79DRAFT_834849 [Phycomyces nitens]